MRGTDEYYNSAGEYMATDILHQLDKLGKALELSNYFEFSIHSFVDNRLVLIGGFDLAYTHEIEIVLHEPLYVSLPVEFSHPKFEVATNEERARIDEMVALEEDTVIKVLAETSRVGGESIPHYIAGERLSFQFGSVYHYERENLKEGERIDDIVLAKRRRGS